MLRWEKSADVLTLPHNHGFVYIRFVGTHAQYDKIDAEII